MSEQRRDGRQENNRQALSDEETAHILGELAKNPRTGEDVTAEKYQNLLEKYDADKYDWRVRDIFKQYIIGFLMFAFVADKLPWPAASAMLVVIVVYLQFLATHYRVDYIKDTALRWHDLFYTFSKRKLLGRNVEKPEEIEPLPDEETREEQR